MLVDRDDRRDDLRETVDALVADVEAVCGGGLKSGRIVVGRAALLGDDEAQSVEALDPGRRVRERRVARVPLQVIAASNSLP